MLFVFVLFTCRVLCVFTCRVFCVFCQSKDGREVRAETKEIIGEKGEGRREETNQHHTNQRGHPIGDHICVAVDPFLEVVIHSPHGAMWIQDVSYSFARTGWKVDQILDPIVVATFVSVSPAELDRKLDPPPTNSLPSPTPPPQTPHPP